MRDLEGEPSAGFRRASPATAGAARTPFACGSPSCRARKTRSTVEPRERRAPQVLHQRVSQPAERRGLGVDRDGDGGEPGLGRRSFDGPLALGPKTVGFDAAPVVWGVPFRARRSARTPHDALGPLLGLLMCLSTLYPVGMPVKGLVQEKETRTRELMSIMGLQSWASPRRTRRRTPWCFSSSRSSPPRCCTTRCFHHGLDRALRVFPRAVAHGVPPGFYLAFLARLAPSSGRRAVRMGMPRYVFFDSEDSQARARNGGRVCSPPPRSRSPRIC